MKIKLTLKYVFFSIPAFASALAMAQSPKSVALGSYECWAWGQARMLMNFKVTSDKRYTNEDGKKKGDYAYSSSTGLITFKGGHLDGILPKGFTAVYHEKNNKPTVSFRGSSGSEAQFCERVNNKK